MSNKIVSLADLETFTKDIRELFTNEAQQNPGDYCDIDLKRVSSDDEYCQRFLLHFKDRAKALKMAKETLKWRKEFGVNEIKESNISKQIADIGGIRLIGKDKEGRENLLYVAKAFKVKDIDMNELKRYWVYWHETLEKRCGNKGFNLVNCTLGAGLSNVDMDFSRFTTNTFTIYYPHVINRAYVYELPFILNAIWKIIKSWMDQDMVNKVVFVDKNTVTDVVDPALITEEFGIGK